jgi:uncharacterized membrane protein
MFRTTWNMLKTTLIRLLNVKFSWLVLFAIFHGLIYFWIFHTSIYQTLFSDLGIYYEYASNIIMGKFPYLDFAIEYPPFSLLFFLIPRLIVENIGAYIFVFAIEVFIFNLVVVYVIWEIAKRLRLNQIACLTIYTVSLLAIGPIILERYDIIPAVATLLSLYFYTRKQLKLAWLFLALGIVIKIYPIVLIPFYIISHINQRDLKQLKAGIFILLLVLVISFLPGVFLDANGLWQSFIYHTERGLQIESSYASVLIFLHNIALITVKVGYDAGSIILVSDLADTFSTVSFWAMTLSLGIIYLFFWNLSKHHKNDTNNLVVNYSFVAIAIFILMGKVFSPQYLIWLLPLVPLVSGQLRHVIWPFFVATCGATYYIFPLNYYELMRLEPTVAKILLGRNALLLFVTILLCIWKRKSILTPSPPIVNQIVPDECNSNPEKV